MDKPHGATSSSSSPSSSQEMNNSAGGHSEGRGSGSLVGMLKAFTQETSMHGLGRVLSSRYCWLRTLWALCVLAGATVAAYNVVKVILIFSTYPVATVVTMEYTSTIQFPAVTICNLNMVRKTQWEKNVLNQHRNPDNQTTQGSSDSSGNNPQYTPEYLQDLRLFLATQDKEIRRQVGHQIDNMLLYCYYHIYSCSPVNFTQFYSSEFGNCYTFNKKREAKTVSRPGPAQGLEILLNAEEDEYMPLTTTTGFKVLIHPHDTMPFPEDEGVMVSPGFTTNVAISKLDIQRTEAPYGKCLNYGKGDQYHLNMYSLEYDVGYSAKACQVTCFQSEMYSRCGCCHRDFPCYLTSASGKSLNAQYCNYSAEQDVLCVIKVSNEFSKEQIGCSDICQPSCKETSFTTEVSLGRWPSSSTEQTYLEQMKNHPSTTGKTVDLDYIRFNIARINIYFKQLNYEHLKTSPAYDWSRLLSDLGGQFGLWLGFSLLTALEIVQLTFDLCERGIKRLCFSKKTGPGNNAMH